MLRKFKRFVWMMRDAALLPVAFIWYASTGKIPGWTGRSHINAFCLTAGKSNDWLSRAVSLRFPQKELELEPGVLRPLIDTELRHIRSALDEKGYAILEQRVPDAICDDLMQFALTHEADLRQTDNAGGTPGKALYDPSHPRAVIYDFGKEDVLANEHVQALLTDPAIIKITQAYLRCEPVADMVSMWWSTAFIGKADGEAAQLFHFDMDRIKWLKVFIYLTDVNPDNGPHYFVEGSHRTGAIPRDLLKKGYARHQDEDIAKHYPPEKIIEFSAPRGTILIEDTRGLHKGQHIRQGHRLMLQFQFSNSSFGPDIPKGVIRKIPNSALARLAQRYPRILSGYDIR